MNNYARPVGWLLLAMGTVLAGITLLAMSGVTELQIRFFGFDLDTRNERLAWVLAWGIAAIAGFVVLRISRRPGHVSEPAA